MDGWGWEKTEKGVREREIGSVFFGISYCHEIKHCPVDAEGVECVFVCIMCGSSVCNELVDCSFDFLFLEN